MAYQPKSYRKFLATSVTAAVVVTGAASVSAAGFDDVVAGSYYTDAVDYLVANGVVQGYPDGTFKPSNGVTRAEAAAMLAASLGLEVSDSPSLGFTDTSNDAWYAGSVEALVEAGIIEGFPNNTFQPSATITRAALAKMVVEAYDLEADADVEIPFNDTVEGAWYESYVNTLYSLGVVNGTTDTTFAPNAVVNRAAAATFLYRTEVPAERLIEVSSVTVVDESTLSVTLSNGTTHTLELAEALEDGSNDVVFTINGVEYTVTVTYVSPDPKVTEVTTANAAQLVVKFNKAVDIDTVIDTDTDTLLAGVVEVSKVSGDGTVATVNNTSLASLSADGKTLTITAAASSFDGYKYVVNVAADTVKDLDGEFFEKFTSNVLETPDTVAPVVSSVDKKNASKVRVNFSEPINVAGNWSFKLANGDAADVSVDSTNIAKGYIDLTIGSVDAGKAISVTAIGVKDYAGNLSSPNPISLEITKGELDGVEPTVTSITPLSLSKFEVKFSEEVQGFTGDDISINGVATADVSAADAALLEAGEAKVTQDKNDKSKFTVELGTAVSEGLNTVAIDVDGVTDLSGETNDAYSKVLEFVADTTAPELVSTEIKKDIDGYEFLYLKFNESVDVVDISALTASQVKDYVTTSGTIDLSAATAVSGSDDKEYKVKLANVTFAAGALEKDASYKVTLNGEFTDKSTNDIEKTSFTFVRGADTLTVGQKVSTVAPGANNSEVVVTFNQDVDGATALNTSNYKIDGVVVEDAEIRAGEPNVVYLTLKEGSNTLSGARGVTISGVKTKDGKAMSEAFTGSVDLVENVAPTFTAELTAQDTITLTFSEAVVVANVDADDLDVFVGNEQESEVVADGFAIAAVDAVDGKAKKFTITLTDALTTTEYANTITVKSIVEAADEIQDVNGNFINATTVTVTK